MRRTPRQLAVAGLLTMTMQLSSVAEERVEKWAYGSLIEEIRAADDGNGDTPFSDSKSKLTINFNDKDSVASLRYGATTRRGSALNQFDWSVAAPLKKDEVSALSLAGPAPDAELSFTATRRWKKFFGQDLGDVSSAQLDAFLDQTWTVREPICERYAQAVFGRSFTKLADEPMILTMNSCSNALFTERNFDKSPKVNKLRGARKYLELAELEELRISSEREFFKDPTSADSRKYREPDAVKSVGLQLKLGEQSFKYVTRENLATSQSDQHAVYGASLFVSRLHRDTLLGGGVQYRRYFESGTAVDVCLPAGASGAQTCSSKVVGKPDKQQANVAFIEARKVFSGSLLGINPKLEFDVEESDWSIRVPIYGPLVDVNDLRFGLSLGWGSKDDEFEATVFLAKAFSLTDFGF
jgi:hypothetical protein